MSSGKDWWVEGDLFHGSVAVAAVGTRSQEDGVAVGNVMPSMWCGVQSALPGRSARGSSTALGFDGLLEMAHGRRSQLSS